MWPGRKLGSRTLRFGDWGPDVKELHQFLRQQGYDLGEEENYGYLTKDAVRQFQRDHGLVADGIAGRRFFALALKRDLPIRRQVHVVAPGETLEQVAEQYGLGPQAFVRYSGNSQIYPGQRLTFFDREVWGVCRGQLQDDPTRALTGVVASSREEVAEGLPCIIRPEQELDPLAVHNCLKTPKRRKKTATALLEAGGGYCGIFLPWQEVPSLDGVRYLKLLKKLKKNLGPAQMLWVELGPGVPPWTLWGGVDYRRVNEVVDRVVVAVPPPAEPGPLLQIAALKEILAGVLRHVHSWKVLLSIPVYALEWELGEEGHCTPFAYSTALARAHRHGARLRQGEQGELFYHYQSRGRKYQMYLPQHTGVAEICTLANRHNLAGVILDSLGLEDPRIWQTLRMHFRTASLNISP